MEINDIAYIYVTAPVKEIRCKCIVEAVNVPADVGDDDGYVLDEEFCSKSYRRYMELKLVDVYSTPALGYHFLLMNGLSGPIRSQRKVSPALEKYIAAVTDPKVLEASENADN